MWPDPFDSPSLLPAAVGCGRFFRPTDIWTYPLFRSRLVAFRVEEADEQTAGVESLDGDGIG